MRLCYVWKLLYWVIIQNLTVLIHVKNLSLWNANDNGVFYPYGLQFNIETKLGWKCLTFLIADKRG
jgi:hypothetical protein